MRKICYVPNTFCSVSNGMEIFTLNKDRIMQNQKVKVLILVKQVDRQHNEMYEMSKD